MGSHGIVQGCSICYTLFGFLEVSESALVMIQDSVPGTGVLAACAGFKDFL